MPDAQPEPAPAAPARAADWEAFYRDYRKPGYVPGFEITTKLGGGMFGLVFRARKQSIGKDYAIKFLQVDDGEVRRAVLAELEQVKFFAQIDHPNLVSIEDRGEVDGIPYLVMSFAGTETLRDKIATDGRVPSAAERDELLRFFLQACRGVAALHERSLVHFDIKPANVFIKGAVARVGDYGLSKLVTHSRGSLSMGRGTPYYMAPEMLQRRGDARSDVYSLGVVLYELLCGKVPFTGDSEWEVLRQHETAAPALPEHLSRLECAVLQRCLQKDPAARFQSVHDVIAAFGAPASAGAAVFGEPVGRGAPSQPFAGAVPPPLPKEPLPPVDDPYKALGRASVEAARQAQRVAKDAAARAGLFSRQAAKHARSAIDGLGPYLHPQPWQRWRQERIQRKEVRRAARSAAREARRAARRARRRSPALFGIAVAGFAMLVLVYTARGSVRNEAASITATVPSPPDIVRAIRPDGLFQTYNVPKPMAGAVSLQMPGWAAIAEANPDSAKFMLAQRLEVVRETAPWAAAQRAGVVDLPQFGRASRQEGAQLVAQRALLHDVRSGDVAPSVGASRLVQFGPKGLAGAADALAKIDWHAAEQCYEGRRLHELLQAATGNSEIEFAEAGELSAEDAAQANGQLAEVWRWFLNEVAYDDPTWQAYERLRDR